MGKLKAEEVIETQKLNHDNPVHLLGLTGTFISDIIIKEISKNLIIRYKHYFLRLSF